MALVTVVLLTTAVAPPVVVCLQQPQLSHKEQHEKLLKHGPVLQQPVGEQHVGEHVEQFQQLMLQDGRLQHEQHGHEEATATVGLLQVATVVVVLVLDLTWLSRKTPSCSRRGLSGR